MRNVLPHDANPVYIDDGSFMLNKNAVKGELTSKVETLTANTVKSIYVPYWAVGFRIYSIDVLRVNFAIDVDPVVESSSQYGNGDFGMLNSVESRMIGNPTVEHYLKLISATSGSVLVSFFGDGILSKVTSSNLRYLARLQSTQTAFRNAIWMMDDVTGRLATSKDTLSVNADLILNGNFDKSGAGGADIWANWTEFVGDGTIADETIVVPDGETHAAKLTAGTSFNTFLRPMDNASISLALFYIRVNPGMSLTFRFWTRGDGTNAGRILVRDQTHNSNIIALKSTGVPGTAYTEVSETFTVPAGCYGLNIALYCPETNGGICYFAGVRLEGDMTLDGIYSPAGIAYGQSGPINNYTAVSCNGTDTHVLVGSVAYNQKFNGNKGSAIAWGKLDGASRWNDLTTHRYLYHIKSTPSLIHYVCMGKPQTAANRLYWIRNAGGSLYAKNYDFPSGGTTDWFCMGMVWDVLSTPKRIACYLYTHADRVWQKISDEAPAVGNEVWDQSVNPVDGENAELLAGTNLSTQEWIGYGGPIAEWGGVCLSDSEMQRVMTP
jgi:hypothetical protein